MFGAKGGHFDSAEKIGKLSTPTRIPHSFIDTLCKELKHFRFFTGISLRAFSLFSVVL
jgi:hypothetical protein